MSATNSSIRATLGHTACRALMAGSSPPRLRYSDHPTIKMLALSFLVVVGVVLVAEAFDNHVPKGNVHFGMAFSLAVEMLNIHSRKKSARKIQRHTPKIPGD